MRIVCDSCGAKYSIADEKIAGKLFKVRCKKCSTMIMVDGTTLAADGTGSGAGAAAAWYVVIDGAQTGPLSHDEIAEQLRAGAVDGETFAWREGMGDWKRLSEIDEFGDLFGGEGFEDEATRVAGTEQEQSAILASVSSLAPAPAVESAAPAPAPAAPRPSGAGLLSHAASAAPAPASDFFGAAASRAPSQSEDAPAQAKADHFTGERNESSVLFSLSDLTAKKKDKGADVPRTEGSGLIDIRVLASSAAPPDSGSAPVAAPGGGGTMAMAPIVALPPRKSNTALIALIAVGCILLAALIAAVIVVGLKDDPAPIAVAPPAPEVPAPAAEPTPEPTEVAAVEAPIPDPVAAPADGSAAAEGSGTDAEAAVAAAEVPEQEQQQRDREEREREATAERESAGSRDERAAREAREERATAPGREEEPAVSRREPSQEGPTQAAGEERSPDAVNRALEALRRGQEAEAAPARREEPAAAPQELTRSDVQSVIRRYRSQIARCAANGETGTYSVRWVIQPSGSVTNAAAESSDDVSRCIVGVVRDMSFPSFQGNPVPVTYPFRL